MHLTLPVAHPALLAVAAAHGCVDAARDPRPYLLLLLPPLPALDTACFCVSSVVHFGFDVGMSASVAGHAFLLLLSLASRRAASGVLFCYILAFHIPLLLRRLISQRAVAEAVAFAVGLAAFLPACQHLVLTSGCFVLTHRMQICIACHVLVDVLHKQTTTPFFMQRPGRR